MNLKISLCIFALLTTFGCFAQNRTDTAFIHAARQHALAAHEMALGSQSRLYNGSRYMEPPFTYEQHPFFLSEDWIDGSVFYDGEYFQNVSLMYDMMNEAIIAEHFPSGHAIQLIREKVRYFTLKGHYFARIENESVQNSLPGTGFYEVLYSGETQLLARRQKFKRDYIDAGQVLFQYEGRDRFFVLRNGIYFQVKSKASILKLMDDKRQEIKKHLKKTGVDFSDDRGRALITVAEFYDTLK